MVHKVILHGKSPVIDNMIQEAISDGAEQSIMLHGPKRMIALLLCFMYTKQSGRISDTLGEILGEELVADQSVVIITFMKLRHLADFLLMAELKAKAYDKLCQLWSKLCVRPKLKLTSSEEKNLNRILVYFFRGSGPLPLVRDQVVWALQAMSSFDPYDDTIMLNREVFLSFLDEISGLKALPELQHLIEYGHDHIDEDIADCQWCGEPLGVRFEPHWLSISIWNEDTWMKRVCGFKGLCSPKCLALDRKLCRQSARCDPCHQRQSSTASLTEPVRLGYKMVLSSLGSDRI